MNQDNNNENQELIDLEKAKHETRYSDSIKKRRFMQKIAIFAFIILALLLATTRFSPLSNYFNNAASNIPKLYNVKDEGIKLAIQNNFIQRVGISDEHAGLVFTVDHLIFDKSRLIVFYTIENTGDHRYIEDLDYDVLDETGNHFEAGKTYPKYNDIDLNKVRKIHDYFDLILTPENEISDSIEVKLFEVIESEVNEEYSNMTEDTANGKDHPKAKELPYTWSVVIPVDKDLFKYEKISYDINKTIEIEGQKLYIDNLTIYPITSILHLRYDEKNSMKIFSIEDLRLYDNEADCKSGLNGFISSNTDDFTRGFYFESNYFRNPKDIYIEGNGIKAIDRDKIEVIVNTEQLELLKAPDNHLKLKKTRAVRNHTNANSFSLHFEYPKEGLSFDFNFKDSKGNILSTNSMGYSSTEEYSEIYFNIPKDLDYEDPITLTLSNYPNIINKPFKVKIK